MGAFADASELAVTNTLGLVLVNSTNTVLVAGTTPCAGYPVSVGNPQFWFDCSQTDGWTIVESAGVKTVSRIPSLVGSRFLAVSANGGYYQAGGFSWTPTGPLFEENAADLGGPALDFGVKGSRRAMFFDPVAVEGGTATNVLRNIGTVVALWYSASGDGTPSKLGDGAWGEGGYYGGALLGGGYGTDGMDANDKSGFVLYRETGTGSKPGNSRALKVESGTYRPRWIDTPLANSSHTHHAIRDGLVRQDGQSTFPVSMGFSGGWETVALVPYTAYGFFNATGLGMNYTAVPDVSGGFKVAEMLIYDKALTVEETALVEAYLGRKWLGRNPRGMNGNAQIGMVRATHGKDGRAYAFDVEMSVPADETLTVGRFAGGRGAGEPGILKTGEGTLEICGAGDFCGSVKMSGGSLAFTGREIPDALPRDVYIHFDASDPASLVVDGEGTFMFLRNLEPDGVYRANQICARPADASNPPAIIEDALGDGLNILDFGDFKSSGGTGYLQLATNETEELSSALHASPEGVSTVIALVGAQRGGGEIAGATRFGRDSNAPVRYDAALLSSTYPATLPAASSSVVMLNGVPADPLQGYQTPGYQVIAIQTAGAKVSRIGSLDDTHAGGLRLGEIAIYRRILSEDELRDASAYMMKKWLRRSAPGYERIEVDEAPELQKVVALSNAAIEVKSGVARIGTLSAEAGVTVTKTGAGTLELQNFDIGELSMAEGKIAVVRPLDVTNECQMAAAPSLHLDVSASNTLEIVEVGGERRVRFWQSVEDRSVMATPPYGAVTAANAYSADSYCPYLSSEVRLNGCDTLDFGPFTQTAGGRRMTLSRPFDSVRSVYVVWTPRDDTRGCPIGCSGGDNYHLYDFLRSSSSVNSAPLVEQNDTAYHVRSGEFYTNGVATTSASVPQPGVFTLTEYHPAGGAHVSALGTDRDIDRFSGGVRMAEIVMYERELSDREKIATRNFLMRKWFCAEAQELPDPLARPVMEKLTVDGDGGFSAEEHVVVKELAGEGNLEKDGATTMEVLNPCGFTGTVAVAGGVFKIGGRRPMDGAGLSASDALIFHADATWGVTAETNNGVVQVTEWKSRLDDGWTARPFYDACRPTLVAADDLNGGLVVDMGKSGDKQAFRFYKDGETNLLTDIGSVIWLVGSHNGGGYLLGGGHNYNNWNGGLFNFMRGSSSGIGDKAGYAILNSGWVCPYNLQSADWRKDGAVIDPKSEGLSGGWDLLSMSIVDTSHPTSNADGFAFDGRTIGGATLENYMGCQRLAEVLIYNRKLADSERTAIEEYLRLKWKFGNVHPSSTNSMSIALSEGAVLDLGGNEQYVAALSGAGVVSNGVLYAGTLAADPTATAQPAFDATSSLAIGPGQRVVVSNAVSVASGTTIPVMTGAVSGTENLSSAVVEIEGVTLPGGVAPRLRYADGTLFVKFVSTGMTVSFR